MKFIDLHNDTLYKCYFEGADLGKNNGHVSIEKMRRGDVLALCFAIFVPPAEEAAREYGVKIEPHSYVLDMVKTYNREMEKNQSHIRPAYSIQQLEDNEKAGPMSAILTLEDCVHLDGKIERVDEMYRLGIRMASLTWNYENSLAYPQSQDADFMKKGLKPFGIEVINRMNDLGIVIDVSHASDGTFWDVVKHSRYPFAASHSCSRHIRNVPRNLSDEMLRAIGEKGGVVGVNFSSYFLQEDPRENYTSIESVIQNIRYIANVAGTDAVALGSDFDGIDSEFEFQDVSGLPQIASALSQSFSSDIVEKICWKNALRLWRDCWKS